MLTVKYVAINGEEQVFPVREIRFDNRNSCPTVAGHAPTLGHVFFDRPAFSTNQPTLEHAYDGIVYVMNEAGKTVAKYDLGGFPLEKGQLTGSMIGVTSIPSAVTFTAGTAGYVSESPNHVSQSPT